MFNTKEKIELAVIGSIILGCLGASAVCYVKSVYYKGRIDATNDMMKEFENIKESIIKERNVETKEEI